MSAVTLIDELIVTPYAGVWIEIITRCILLYQQYESLPTRECGLKLKVRYRNVWMPVVTPYAGVWIEINSLKSKVLKILSLPTRECGLK